MSSPDDQLKLLEEARSRKEIFGHGYSILLNAGRE